MFLWPLSCRVKYCHTSKYRESRTWHTWHAMTSWESWWGSNWRTFDGKTRLSLLVIILWAADPFHAHRNWLSPRILLRMPSFLWDRKTSLLELLQSYSEMFVVKYGICVSKVENIKTIQKLSTDKRNTGNLEYQRESLEYINFSRYVGHTGDYYAWIWNSQSRIVILFRSNLIKSFACQEYRECHSRVTKLSMHESYRLIPVCMKSVSLMWSLFVSRNFPMKDLWIWDYLGLQDLVYWVEDAMTKEALVKNNSISLQDHLRVSCGCETTVEATKGHKVNTWVKVRVVHSMILSWHHSFTLIRYRNSGKIRRARTDRFQRHRSLKMVWRRQVAEDVTRISFSNEDKINRQVSSFPETHRQANCLHDSEKIDEKGENQVIKFPRNKCKCHSNGRWAKRKSSQTFTLNVCTQIM